MVELARLVNKYAAKKTSLGTPPPKEWQEFVYHLQCAFRWIEREHSTEIYIKQLTLL